MAWGDGAWAEGQPGPNWTMLDGRARWRVGPRRPKPKSPMNDGPDQIVMAESPFGPAASEAMPPVQPLDDTKAPAAPESSGGGFDLGKYLTLGQGAAPGMMTPGQSALLAFGSSLLANPGKRGAAGAALLEGAQAQQFAAQQGEQARRRALEEARAAKLDARGDEQYASEKAQAAARQAAIGKLSPEEQQMALMDPAGFAKARTEAAFREAKAPQTRTINQGGLEVSQEWDPATKSWTEIGRGSRWAPQQGPSPLEQERLKLAQAEFEWKKQHPGEASGEPMVEVYDPNSPTGTSYVPRSQAAGKPGKPGSDGIEVTQPDGTTFRVGGKGGGAKLPTGYQEDPANPSRIMPIPGGPGEKANESAQGKLALVPGALKDLSDIRSALIEAPGNPNRSALASMNNPVPIIGGGSVPGTQGVGLRAKFDAALDTIIRVRTGAAATPAEMDQQRAAYMPNVTDPPNVVEEKLSRLERDLKAAEQEYSRGTGGPREPSTPAAAAPPAAAAAPVQIKGDDDYAKLPSGALFIGPDGKQRQKP